ncbi:MAG: AAA-like domain-containing protein [Chloroflexi bacterium]|uniref:AAA-like domain-containing protein n=1 Tax=Candidatus Chlorohelix allophototropha TaxID=3003348 RepID=A0A8T7M4F3_9CHLR|nr:AAA-like domain-containing protein [Chloroflexota bacterium]WJW70051.1 AAA-like domain-containing protein [Chloroflexota bacterium L227-S17]
MAQIKNKELVARQIKDGLRAIASHTTKTVERVDQDIAPQLAIEARTLKSWKTPSAIPDNIDEDKLLGLIWLILEHGGLSLAWLTTLLSATSLPVVDPPTPSWVRSYLKIARVASGAGSTPLSESAIERTIEHLFYNGITGIPSSPASTHLLEFPDGIMSPESPFYIERASDTVALNTLKSQGAALVIKAPRQMGKSSLLLRISRLAEKLEKRVVLMDCQRFDKAALTNPDLFYRLFCGWLGNLLKLDNRVEEFWSEFPGNIQHCSNYLEEYLLPELNSPLVLAMDEVDHLFDTPFRSDFFGMLRSWHNARQLSHIWKNLDLVLVTSTQPYQFVQDLNQSPFNVGIILELEDFTPGQVAELNRRHGYPFLAEEEAKLIELTGGQPYLTRQALYMVANGSYTPDRLFEKANDEYGPFGEHLRYYFQRLHHNPQLVEGLRTTILANTCSDETTFWRLQGAGLVRRHGKKVIPRCKLYNDYFRERLL